MSLYDPKILPNVQEVFNEARAIVKSFFGLELTLIELVRLKECSEAASKDLRVIEHTQNSFHPRADAVARFLHLYYDIPLDYEPMHEQIGGVIDKPFCVYLKIIQSRKHLP